jgi:hypothetical protein
MNHLCNLTLTYASRAKAILPAQVPTSFRSTKPRSKGKVTRVKLNGIILIFGILATDLRALTCLVR